jgi:hypothetical protein
MTEQLDSGAYIGHEPELEEESIPGGVKPGDERVDVIEGPIGSASLREPSEIEDEGAGADLDALPRVEVNPPE